MNETFPNNMAGRRRGMKAHRLVSIGGFSGSILFGIIMKDIKTMMFMFMFWGFFFIIFESLNDIINDSGQG